MNVLKIIDAHLVFIFVVIGFVAFAFWFFFSLHKKNKTNLNARINSAKIYPYRLKYAFALMIYYLCQFSTFVPILWLLKTLTFSFVWLFPLLYLFMLIPAYPYYTLSVDSEKISGATLWGWLWRREEINLSEIHKEKVLRQNFGKLLGITIFYSIHGKKILTLGLDNLQISKILNLVKNSD
jgi:hypothetical protein